MHQGLDFWHLMEKLGAASKLLDGDHDKCINRWRMCVLNVEHASRFPAHGESGRATTTIVGPSKRPIFDSVYSTRASFQRRNSALRNGFTSSDSTA